MKRLIYFIAIILFMVGCENVLDIQPTDMISETSVKNDPKLVDAFLNGIYNDTRLQAYDDFYPNQAMIGAIGGEQNVFASWQAPYQSAIQIIDENGAHELVDYWPYKNIRAANELLVILEEGDFEEEFIEQKSAEARFLRAFMYFELVKRYGGVPLITKPQSIDAVKEELYVSRNTEKEIYDFVALELDDLVELLPDSYDSDEFGRASKWAAYALQSRAMLYAASIAKYGTVQLDGILGIPASEADSYYQKSYDASMEIINNSPHYLYQENPDPVDNYYEIFIVDGNPEVIFAEVYDYSLDKAHGWNTVSITDGFAGGWGSNNWFYLESFEKYEYRDGSSGKLDWETLDGNTKYDLADLILNKDPRYLASSFYPEMTWQDGTVYFHSSTVGTIPDGSDWPEMAPIRNRLKTGLQIRKRVDESVKRPNTYADETDWIVFRVGEMYLNAAEAAFEGNDEPEARRLVNIIRNRAGMPDKNVLTIDDIRNERFVELFIEEHRYWDLRRWRIAEEELNGKAFHGVSWVYYMDDDRYGLELKDGDFGGIRTFLERHYYLPLTLNRIADNPNLVENPGY